MNTKEISKKNLNELHKVELEILDEIKRICEKNNIEYFLIGGTLLGAVRHGGFIPWDDDIDIALERSQYEKFIEACKKDLDSKYYLDYYKTNKMCYLPYLKLRKNNTTFIERDSNNIDSHKGIFVDIFPFDLAGDNWRKYKIKCFIIRNFIETIFYKKKVRSLKDCHHSLVVKAFSIFSCDKIFKKIEKMSKNGNGKKKTHFLSYYGSYDFNKEYLPIDVLFPLKEICFEGKKYFGMNKNNEFLTSVYGDYMKLPPKDKRIAHSPLKISFKSGMNITKK